MEAMKRMRLADFVRSGIVGLGVLVGLVLLDIESKSGLEICQYHVMYKVIDLSLDDLCCALFLIKVLIFYAN